jgi:hypothetical protein
VQVHAHGEAESGGEVDAHGALDGGWNARFLDSHDRIIEVAALQQECPPSALTAA